MEMNFNIEGGDFINAGVASSQVKKELKQFSISPLIIRRVAVALYEAEVNVVAHAYRGVISVDINSDHVHVKIEDEGPGIEDINKAMEEGFSTASDKVREMGFGAGMGLPNIKRNTDKMILKSKLGVGTVIEFMVCFNK
jgi:anti-sigma regulatory factor (Ser/Thr protein kinase)